MNYEQEKGYQCAAKEVRVSPNKINECCDVQPVREISLVLDELKGNINRFDNLVNSLGIRLQPVLSSAPLVDTENQKMPVRYTDLGNYIDGLRLQLRGASNNLESIIERIEL